MSKTMNEFLAALPEMPENPVAAPVQNVGHAEAKADVSAQPAAPPSKEAVVRALLSGDLEVVAEYLECDVSQVDKKARKWAAQQAKLAAAEGGRKSAEQKAAELEAASAPFRELEKAAKSGDYAKLFDVLAERFGDSPDALLTKAVRARAVRDPRAEALEAKLKVYEEKEQAEGARVATTAEGAYVAIIRDEVPADHDVRKIPGWAKKVARTVKASIDPEVGEPRLSPKQAATRVLRKERERFEARAAVFGGGARPEAKSDPLARVQQPTRGGGAGKLSKEQFFASFNARPS